MARTERVLFTTPFFMLFVFFILKYLFLLFGGISNWHILILTIIIGLMHFLPTLLETKKSRGITRFIARIYGFFVWCSLMFLIELIFINVLRLFISIPIGIIVLLLAVVPLFGLYNYHHAHQIKVKERTLTFDDLKEDVNILHLTDVHFGSLMHAKSMKNLAEELKNLEDVCDLAIISGDLADGSCIIEEDSFMPLSDVDMPIIFSSGNHDFYPGIDNVFKACNAAGIIVLDNEQINFKDLSIFGFTYSFGPLPPVSEQTLRDAIKEDSVNVMIYHVPERWEEFSDLGFNLQLSGHTHGGQFHPVTFLANIILPYNMGLFERFAGGKKAYLHVSTGVGVMDYPMRWGTDSELVILKLRKG